MFEFKQDKYIMFENKHLKNSDINI